MHAVVRRYQVEPDSVDEVARRVEEGFAPIVSEAPGFVAYYLLGAGDGVIASVSVFENREEAEESSERAADWVGENLASLLPEPPGITAGEVGVHEVGKERGRGGYASIRRYQINQGAVSAALGQFNDGIVPILGDQPGFVEYYGFEAESEIVAVNVFESRSEAEESNEVAAGYVEENLLSVLPLSPEITSGEVLVHA